MTKMKAVVIHEAGGPEVLKIETQLVPMPQSGELLIRVKAFGLNRSELFTRQGHSPGVKFPRILSIEAVGLGEGEVLRVSPRFILEKMQQGHLGNWHDPTPQLFLADLRKSGLK